MFRSRITEGVSNPGATSVAVFVSMLLVSIGSWGLEHSEHGQWSEMLTPRHVFSFLGVMGSVLGAWLSKSPVRG